MSTEASSSSFVQSPWSTKHTLIVVGACVLALLVFSALIAWALAPEITRLTRGRHPVAHPILSPLTTLDTVCARELLPFTSSSGKSYIVVPQKSTVVETDPQPTSLDAGNSDEGNTVVYQVDTPLTSDTKFTKIQTLTTPGAHGAAIQDYDGDTYLAVPSVRQGTYPTYSEDVESSIWRWDDETESFIALQTVPLTAAKDCSMHVIDGDLFLFFACGSALTTDDPDDKNNSPVLRYNKISNVFETIQSITTYGAFNLTVFEVGSVVYLGVVDATSGTTLYTWDSGSEQFVLDRTLTTDSNGREITSISMGTGDVSVVRLALTNLKSGTGIYRVDVDADSGEHTFVLEQTLTTELGGAHNPTFFQDALTTRLFVSHYIAADSTQAAPVVRTDSSLYTWDSVQGKFVWLQNYASSASASSNVWKVSANQVLVTVANESDPDFNYATTSSVYKMNTLSL